LQRLKLAGLLAFVLQDNSCANEAHKPPKGAPKSDAQRGHSRDGANRRRSTDVDDPVSPHLVLDLPAEDWSPLREGAAEAPAVKRKRQGRDNASEDVNFLEATPRVASGHQAPPLPPHQVRAKQTTYFACRNQFRGRRQRGAISSTRPSRQPSQATLTSPGPGSGTGICPPRPGHMTSNICPYYRCPHEPQDPQPDAFDDFSEEFESIAIRRRLTDNTASKQELKTSHKSHLRVTGKRLSYTAIATSHA
ncbi:hypothetical protein RRG08_065681, partial [Elysia crispata]